nr:spermatid nuclear transition protein 4-like [Microcebus murinus]
MTKVIRKPQNPRTVIVQLTSRTKGKKKRKILCQPRFIDSVEVPKAKMMAKSSLQGSSIKKSQTSTNHSKKLKKARSTICVYYHKLNKKWSQTKRQNQNKRQNQQRRNQNKKPNQNKRRVRLAPEQKILEKMTSANKDPPMQPVTVEHRPESL